MKIVRDLKNLFQQLIDLSARQLDALDRDAFDVLHELGEKKEELVRDAAAKLETLRRLGYDFTQNAPSKGERLKDEFQELHELIWRYQACDKYLTGQVTIARDRISHKLSKVLERKDAASRYHKRIKPNRALDRAC